VAQVLDFTLVGFRGHDDAVAYLGGVRKLLGLLRRHEPPGVAPRVVSRIVETTEEFQVALRAPARVQVVSTHAGNGVFLSHDERHRVAVNEIRPGARAAVILDCCDGEAVLDGIAKQVQPGVVVVAASAVGQGCSLYAHDSMATFLPVLSELAWEWSGYGRDGLRPSSIRRAVERAATAVVALRDARNSSPNRPVLIARQDEDELIPGATTFGPR
jgi:hypothetical protein